MMAQYSDLGRDSKGREVINVTEECPVCGDVSEQVWRGHASTTGDGFHAEQTEILSDCGH
jgi:hypothetical protein